MHKELRNLKVFGFGWAFIILVLYSLHIFELRPSNGWVFLLGVCLILFIISLSVNKRIIYQLCFWALFALLIFSEKRLNKPETWQMLFLGMMGISSFFYVMASWKPTLLKPLYIPWMKIVHVIGGFFTIVIFTLVYFLLFTPISLLLKCLKKDLLKSKINKDQLSYWHERDLSQVSKERYLKQF